MKGKQLFRQYDVLTVHLSGLFKTGKEKTGKGHHVYRQGKAASSKESTGIFGRKQGFFKNSLPAKRLT